MMEAPARRHADNEKPPLRGTALVMAHFHELEKDPKQIALHKQAVALFPGLFVDLDGPKQQQKAGQLPSSDESGMTGTAKATAPATPERSAPQFVDIHTSPTASTQPRNLSKTSYDCSPGQPQPMGVDNGCSLNQSGQLGLSSNQKEGLGTNVTHAGNQTISVLEQDQSAQDAGPTPFHVQQRKNEPAPANTLVSSTNEGAVAPSKAEPSAAADNSTRHGILHNDDNSASRKLNTSRSVRLLLPEDQAGSGKHKDAGMDESAFASAVHNHRVLQRGGSRNSRYRPGGIAEHLRSRNSRNGPGYAEMARSASGKNLVEQDAAMPPVAPRAVSRSPSQRMVADTNTAVPASKADDVNTALPQPPTMVAATVTEPSTPSIALPSTPKADVVVMPTVTPAPMTASKPMQTSQAPVSHVQVPAVTPRKQAPKPTPWWACFGCGGATSEPEPAIQVSSPAVQSASPQAVPSAVAGTPAEANTAKLAAQKQAQSTATVANGQPASSVMTTQATSIQGTANADNAKLGTVNQQVVDNAPQRTTTDVKHDIPELTVQHVTSNANAQAHDGSSEAISKRAGDQAAQAATAEDANKDEVAGDAPKSPFTLTGTAAISNAPEGGFNPLVPSGDGTPTRMAPLRSSAEHAQAIAQQLPSLSELKNMALTDVLQQLQGVLLNNETIATDNHSHAAPVPASRDGPLTGSRKLTSHMSSKSRNGSQRNSPNSIKSAAAATALHTTQSGGVFKRVLSFGDSNVPDRTSVPMFSARGLKAAPKVAPNQHMVDGRAKSLPSWLMQSPKMLAYQPPWDRSISQAIPENQAVSSKPVSLRGSIGGFKSPRNAGGSPLKAQTVVQSPRARTVVAGAPNFATAARAEQRAAQERSLAATTMTPTKAPKPASARGGAASRYLGGAGIDSFPSTPEKTVTPQKLRAAALAKPQPSANSVFKVENWLGTTSPKSTFISLAMLMEAAEKIGENAKAAPAADGNNVPLISPRCSQFSLPQVLGDLTPANGPSEPQMLSNGSISSIPATLKVGLGSNSNPMSTPDHGNRTPTAPAQDASKSKAVACLTWDELDSEGASTHIEHLVESAGEASAPPHSLPNVDLPDTALGRTTPNAAASPLRATSRASSSHALMAALDPLAAHPVDWSPSELTAYEAALTNVQSILAQNDS